MEYNRFLTNKYAKRNDLDDPKYNDFRMLQGVMLLFTRLQVFIDNKNTYKALINNIDDKDKPYFTCPDKDFIYQKKLGLNFIKYLNEHQTNVDLMNHPYISLLRNQPCLSKPDFQLSFGDLNDNTPIFDMENYIKLICRVNDKGEIVGFTKDILNEEYDRKTLEELEEAIDFSQKIYNEYTDEKIRKNNRTK